MNRLEVEESRIVLFSELREIESSELGEREVAIEFKDLHRARMKVKEICALIRKAAAKHHGNKIAVDFLYKMIRLVFKWRSIDEPIVSLTLPNYNNIMFWCSAHPRQTRRRG